MSDSDRRPGCIPPPSLSAWVGCRSGPGQAQGSQGVYSAKHSFIGVNSLLNPDRDPITDFFPFLLICYLEGLGWE